MSDIVPRNQVAKSGVKGVGALVGGAGLLVLNALPPVPAIIAGAALAVVGFALSGSRSDRVAGIVTAAAGIVTLASGLLHVGWMLWIPGIGLLAAGVYSLVKFFRGMKSRS
jgi:CHASE2 domain-containing sensor protein